MKKIENDKPNFIQSLFLYPKSHKIFVMHSAKIAKEIPEIFLKILSAFFPKIC